MVVGLANKDRVLISLKAVPGVSCCVTVCAFPYILAFTTDSIEIRLVVNGNLVYTAVVPELQLVASRVSTMFHHLLTTVVVYRCKSSHLTADNICFGSAWVKGNVCYEELTIDSKCHPSQMLFY